MTEKTSATAFEFQIMLAEIRDKPPKPKETTEQIASRMALRVKERRQLKAGLAVASSLAEEVFKAAGYERGIPQGWIK